MGEGGWHADPFGRFEYRYLNGERWTDQVSTAGVVSTDPPVASPSPPVQDVEVPEGRAEPSVSVPVAGPAPQVGVAPTGDRTKLIALVVAGIVVLVVAVVAVLLVRGGDDSPGGVAVSPDAVWVSNWLGGSVWRIDLETLEVTDEIYVGVSALGVAASPDAVWVPNRRDDSVSRIDIETLEVTNEIDVGDEPHRVAVSPDAVWVTSLYDHSVSRIG